MRARIENKTPSNNAKAQTTDRLTLILTCVALVLLVAIVAIGADLWLHPAPGGAGTPSLELTQIAAQRNYPPTATKPSPAAIPATPPPCIPPQDWVTHAVVEGDTLYSLAQRYEVTVDALQRVNCLQDDIIIIDQELFVPGPQGVPGGSDAPLDVQVNTTQDWTNIILLGSDKRADNRSWRTDTMIVVSVDAQRDTVRLLSIPRDLWVDIPGHGFDRINTADLWGELAREGGGPDLVKQTVRESLGIPIHYYVRVNFEGFMKVIDTIGGVDFYVDCPLTDLGLQPGLHHMDGRTALRYARSRTTTSDFDRSNRQRKLLMALWEQGLTKDIIPKLPALWKAMAGTIQTDLPLHQVISLANTGLRVKPDQVRSRSIGPWQVENWITPQGAAVLLPRNDEIKQLLDSFYGPQDIPPQASHGKTTVQILNGSQRVGADKLAATALSWAGFEAAGSGLASATAYTETQIIVYDAEPGVAEALARQLDVITATIQHQQDPSAVADIQVILGADYDPCAIR